MRCSEHPDLGRRSGGSWTGRPHRWRSVRIDYRADVTARELTGLLSTGSHSAHGKIWQLTDVEASAERTGRDNTSASYG